MVANCLKRCLNRAGDMVGRYGGEEFIAVLPETPYEGAINVAEVMRGGVEALNIAHPDSTVANAVTISVGLATAIPAEGVSVPKIVSLADRALFQAKHQGRNRIVTAGKDGSLEGREGDLFAFAEAEDTANAGDSD